MKTAEDFWNYSCKNEELKSPSDIMIQFAKLHVEAALKAASKKAIVHNYIGEGGIKLNKNSILNAYPESNIK